MSWPTATCGPRPAPRRPRCSPGWRNMPTTRKRCGCMTCSAACCRAAPPCPPRRRAPEPLSPEAALAPEDRAPSSPAVARNPGLDRAVRDRAREGNASAALGLIARAKGLSPAYAGLLRADLAIGLFRAGQDEEALRIAAEAARRRRGERPGRLRRRPLGLGARPLRHRPALFRARPPATTRRPPRCAPPPPSGPPAPRSGRASRSSMSPG